MISVEDLVYELPSERIARYPTERREEARLLIVDRDSQQIRHAHVRDLPELVPPSLWVANDTRVVPARLRLRRQTGGLVESLFLDPVPIRSETQNRPQIHAEKEHDCAGHPCWLRPGSKLRIGESLAVVGDSSGHRLELVGREGKTWRARLHGPLPLPALLERCGEVPLPPYLQRPAEAEDRGRYQTVYAKHSGSVAAPTAGLHFTPELIEGMQTQGHRWTSVTLHVGAGTFSPLEGTAIEEHFMHSERYVVSADTALAIEQGRAQDLPITAVGTTSVRTLESAAADDSSVRAESASTDLFIRPPFRFRVVDALLTNFHLPRSTLLALVMALGGVELIKRAYREAIDAGYRFYSYGDAMLITAHRANR